MKKIIVLFSFLLLCSFSFSQSVPKNLGFVSDYEKIFTPEQTDILTKILSDYERETSIEIAVLTVPEIEGDGFDFAQETAETWGVGKKDIDNGLLIVLSKNSRLLRSQTGYGLEGYLPDGWLKHTGDSVVREFLSKDNYFEGVVAFLNSCKERIGKEGYSQDHNEELINKNKEDESIIGWMIHNVPWWVWIIIIGLWIIIFIFNPSLALQILFLGLSRGGSGGGGFSGGKFGGGGSSSKW